MKSRLLRLFLNVSSICIALACKLSSIGIIRSVIGNARIYASSEIIEYVCSFVSFCELNKFVTKGNHGSSKCCSHEKTTTVVASHWKVIRATMENLSKDLHLYRSLVDAHDDFHISFAVAGSWKCASLGLWHCCASRYQFKSFIYNNYL